MSQNLQPAFIGHPGVLKQTLDQRRANSAHAQVMLPPGLEYRVKFKDGTRTNWAPIARGAMHMPPAAVLVELRRAEDKR